MAYERIPFPATPGYFDLDVNDLHPPEEEEDDDKNILIAKRRYSESLFDYTKALWMTARTGIDFERAGSFSSISSVGSSIGSLEATLRAR